jgi:uncharacterized membrane protein (UPF0127 family)
VKNANLVSGFVCGLALFLSSAGCAAKEAAHETPKTIADFFTLKVGDHPVRMQLAVHRAEMERGLMGRTNLGSDEGMLFVYEAPQQLSFWMHDTPTPLDIGFFTADGELVEIYPLLPFDERTVGSRSTRLKFALEMNQNWYRDHGVKPSAKLDLEALAAALKARGFDPRKFGLSDLNEDIRKR